MNTKNPATGGVPRISRILVAIDFSFHASNALQWARSLADAFGAKLILLHVIDAIAEIGADIDGVMTGIDSFQLLRDEAHKCMGELKALIPDAQIVIREASARPAIVDVALEMNCQMIVMGSVAEYVVRHSKVPVLTVRGN
jgi:nucleotide-binding universal stress UspA family protein